MDEQIRAALLRFTAEMIRLTGSMDPVKLITVDNDCFNVLCNMKMPYAFIDKDERGVKFVNIVGIKFYRRWE